MKNFNDERLIRMIEKRPRFKTRAVVTSGMPYGNKELHFGHVGGMMVHADFFARFLRDRIGKENVLFVSGTDCYGSPILEGYRKIVEKGFVGTIEDYVKSNHEKQFKTIEDYEIEFDLFGGSAFGESKDLHVETSKEIFDRLYQLGALTKMSTLQFFDATRNTFLNGRQVIGKCPIEGCQSEKAYADECELGHQYFPKNLINPVSTLSNETPELKEITNWYFNLPEYVEILNEWLAYLEKETPTREFITKEMKEFLKRPEIYIKNELENEFNLIKYKLPTFVLKDIGNKSSFTIVFDKLTDRETACQILAENNIRYRTGKTLVPFRLTGNIEWGVPVPKKDDSEELTFWVWPESLWAPISFTKACLIKKGKKSNDWKNWWCCKDSAIYQFIGEDNISFYGPAQTAMWLATQGENPSINVPENNLMISNIVANKHILFLNKKASSSSDIKPPMAQDLLKFYTPEQLRCHFLGLGLGNNNVSFMPKCLNPDANPDEVDPVLKEGNLLTNVFNKILRTLLYTVQRDFNGVVPKGEHSEEVEKEATYSILKYEKLMFDNKFHVVMSEIDCFVRNINKNWIKETANVQPGSDEQKQAIVNAFYLCKIAMVLIHPAAPSGCENLAKFLKIDECVFDWENINAPIYNFVEYPDNYTPNFLEPRVDFFKKHQSQLNMDVSQLNAE